MSPLVHGATQVDIIQAGGLQLSFDPKVIVGDKAEDGVITGEMYDGTSTVGYKASTRMEVKGTPGETVTIRLDNNIEPVAWYFMNGLGGGGTVEDIYFDYDGVASEVNVDTAKFVKGGGSFSFDGSGKVEIPDAAGLHIDRLAFEVDINVSSVDQDQVLVSKDGNYQFRLVVDGTSIRPQFEVKTTQGIYTATSSRSLQVGQWAKLYAAVDNGRVLVRVDGVETSAPASGSMQHGETPIVCGEGFKGNLDDLKIFDLSRPGLLGFGNGLDSIQVTLDENGKGYVEIKSKGNLRLNCPQQWMVEAKAFYEGVINDPSSSKIAVMSAKALWHVVNIAQGAVLGEGEGAEAVAADIAASLVIYGDLRDLVLLAPKFYFGFADVSDEVILTFAGLGVVATVYPPLDAFAAAGKAGAKLLKGSTKLLKGLVNVGEELLNAKSIDVGLELAKIYGPFLKKIAENPEYLQTAKRIFGDGVEDGIIDKPLEKLVYFEKDFGGTSADLIALEKKLSNVSEINLDSVLRQTIDAADRLRKAGIQLTPQAAEGVAILMAHARKLNKKVFIGDANRIDRILRSIPDGPKKAVIVEEFFSLIKWAHESGYTGVRSVISVATNFDNSVKGGLLAVSSG
jgi:hypothetical protein